jgi:hypothetical protein
MTPAAIAAAGRMRLLILVFNLRAAPVGGTAGGR